MKQTFSSEILPYKLNTDIGLACIRIFTGLGMLFGHGLGKWTKLFGDESIQFADPFGLGPSMTLALVVFAEVICALFVALGLLTRWALIPLIITMAMAAFNVHINDGFGGMEKALLYGITFLALFFTGPGKYSVDYLMAKNYIKKNKQ